MTPEQIALIQDSFSKVVPIRDEAARLFYARLFELDPTLESLFHGDMTEQGRKLMTALTLVVNGLKDLESLLPMVRALGERHAGYGAQAGHYRTVAEALLWTLEQGLGDAFTDDTRQAWAAAYGVLSGTMIEAAAARAA